MNDDANSTATTVLAADEDATDTALDLHAESQLFSEKSRLAAKRALGVVHRLESGLINHIDAYEEIYNAIESFADDQEQIDSFMRVLVEHGLVPAAEARLGLSSSKLSKLRKIGEHADLLRRPEIVAHLIAVDCRGSSVLYEVAVTFGHYLGSEEERYRKLVKGLQTNKPSTLREFQEHAKSVKTATAPEQEGLPADIGGHATTVVQLVAATVFEPKDLDRLRVFDQDPPQVLWIGERMSDDAAAVVATSFRELPLVANRLLNSWNMHILRIFAPHEVSRGSNVADDQAIVVAARAKRTEDLPGALDSEEGDRVDVLDIAMLLFPNVDSRLHVLAKEDADGWECLIGKANWVVRDE